MPKIFGDSLADHREQVRQRLFASIAELIAARGYDSITLADIAAGAGVGRTAVYNHFPDKESVLLTWAHDETERYVTELKSALLDVTDPFDRLEVFIRRQMTELAGHHARLAGVGSALSTEGRREIRAHVRPMMQILREIVAQCVGTDRATEGYLDAAVAMISAVTTTRRTIGLSGDALDEAVAAAIDFVKHGIGAP